MPLIEPANLGALHTDVEYALERGDDRSLTVVGWGEISLVVGWPPHAPEVIAKRLPPFPSRARLGRYAALLGLYIRTLQERGVHVVETEVHDLEVDGEILAYLVQPRLPADQLVPAVLAQADPADDHPIVDRVVEHVVAVVDEHTGLDAQLSNWVWDGDRLTYLDVSTPFVRDENGADQMDLDVLLEAYPRPLRAPLRRWVAPDILDRYHDRRSVLRDLLANLIKERLDAWGPAFLAAANRHLDEPITKGEIRRDYRSDARTWAWVQRVRRTDRAWYRVRGRTYPYLLPRDIER